MAKRLTIPFPMKGLDVSAPFSAQPEGTTADCSNVRPQDVMDGRLRGGKRPSLDMVHYSAQSMGGSILLIVPYSSTSAIYVTHNGTRAAYYYGTPASPAAVPSTPTLTGTSIAGTYLQGKVYLSDENGYFDVITISSMTSAALTASAGSLPTGGQKVMAGFRSRMVVAGADHQWYMSKVSDPTNWNYAPSPRSSVQAVAGGTFDAEALEHTITALIPWSDDLLVVGCERGIWQMTGDPAYGGQIDRVSDAVGMLYQAWCKDEAGTIYFASYDGVYALPAGAKPAHLPVKISGPIDPLWSTTSQRVRLAWNIKDEMLMVSLTGTTGTNTVFCWHRPTDGWWRESYPAACGPFSWGEVGGVLYVGCYDGSLRKFDTTGAIYGDVTAYTSAAGGTRTLSAVSSYLLLGPMAQQDAALRMLLASTRVILDESSAGVTLQLLAGDSAEEAKIASAAWSATLAGGRSNEVLRRVRCGAAYYKLAHAGTSNTWAFESITVQAENAGVYREKPS